MFSLINQRKINRRKPRPEPRRRLPAKQSSKRCAMKRRTELGGVIPATVTPFREDESIDEEAMLRLMDWNLSQGVEAFFIGGSSAECFLLNSEERIRTFEIAVQRKDRAFLIAHVGAISIREAEDYARHAVRLGFDAVAATPPFYYGFSSREIAAYYEDIAQAVGKPVLIYNFPDASTTLLRERARN